MLSQTLAEGYCSFTGFLFSNYRAMAACSLQFAALLHLAILAFAEICPDVQRIMPAIVVTGLIVIFASIAHWPHHEETGETLAQPADLAVDVCLARLTLSPREVALERQSQRLVEIADTAVRSRSQAEERGQCWADLMSRVSHELRTPLNAVIGFSDCMNAEIFGPLGHPRYREYIHHIRDSGRALLKSAEDTLALTALLAQPSSASKPEVLPLDDYAAEAWAFVAQDEGGRRLTLATSGLDGLEVLGERRPLRQILVNLLSAAAARAADGTVIEIGARLDGDIVELEIAVPATAHGLNCNDGSLAFSLARALLELQDSFLIELKDIPGSWRAVTVLPVATQQDFFASVRGAPAQPDRAYVMA